MVDRNQETVELIFYENGKPKWVYEVISPCRTLSKKLAEVGCKLFVVAVGGAPTTNSVSFRGDSIKQWSKMINPMGAGAIMTNKPLALKKYVDSL